MTPRPDGGAGGSSSKTAMGFCFKHPGFAIDPTVSTRLRPMASSVRPASPDEAVRSRAVHLEGSRAARAQLRGVVPASYEYEGEPARQAAAMLKDATSASRAATRRYRLRTAQPS